MSSGMQPMGAAPSDAALVSGVLAGDRDAFAAVYDRYADRLHDFAYSMLRHREDAADAVADAFVTTAERLEQLRDPERLRPWLYAVVRRECLRRLKARSRTAYGGEDHLLDLPEQSAAPETLAEQESLRALVWEAAGGLNERDRAMLDLHLRQGLDGAELGEAMGMSADNAYVGLSRLRDQVERSIGALLVARTSRHDCTELTGVLDDWDGEFTPLVRKRVARHVDRCKVCTGRRVALASPAALLAGVPAFAAPVLLRERVLEDSRLVAALSSREGGGGPGAGGGAAGNDGSGRRGNRSRAVAGLALALLLVLVVVAVWQDKRADEPITGRRGPGRHPVRRADAVGRRARGVRRPRPGHHPGHADVVAVGPAHGRGERHSDRRGQSRGERAHRVRTQSLRLQHPEPDTQPDTQPDHRLRPDRGD